MSKNKKGQGVGPTLASPQGKTVEEMKEIVQTLQTQLQEHQSLATHHQTKVNHHQTMATKAQGALEVMLQMIPKEEVDQMIVEEAKENHQEMETSDG